MTFHTFNPSTDTLEVGTKIRLAGREGEMQKCDVKGCALLDLEVILFDDGSEEHIDLYKYTFEIADKPAEPLTIDKRVKEEIEKRLINTNGWGLQDKGIFLEGKIKDVYDYLNSLEET